MSILISNTGVPVITGGKPVRSADIIPDTTGPIPISMTPSVGSSSAAVSTTISVTFDEPVYTGTGNVTLHAVGGSDVEAFDVVSDAGTGSGQISVSGSSITFIPTSNLTENTQYSVRFDAGCLKDVLNNDILAISGDTWEFTTAVAINPEPTAHVTIAASALKSKLDEWDADWSGTATSLGLSTSDERYIDVNSGSMGSVTLDGRSGDYDFSTGNGRAKVHVRSTDRAGGAYFAGSTRAAYFRGIKNMRFAFLGWRTQEWELRDAPQDVTIERCHGFGTSTPGDVGTSNHGIYISGGTGAGSNILIKDNLIERWGGNCITCYSVTSGLEIIGNVLGEGGGDAIWIKNCSGAYIAKNWGPTYTLQTSVSKHVDYIQLTQTASTDVTVERNVFMVFGNTTSAHSPRQGAQFGSPGGHDDASYIQNIISAQTIHACNLTGSNGSAISNTAFHVNGSFAYSGNNSRQCKFNGGWNSALCSDNIESTTGTPLGSGSLSVMEADLDSYFGGLADSADSHTFLGNGADFSDMYPKTGTRAHWNHASKVGAAERLREIFVDGDHPGNVGWPVADFWDSAFNARGRITS